MSKIPEKLRAKAMNYAPYVEEADSTTASTGSVAAASASMR